MSVKLKVIEMAPVDSIEINHPLLILIPLDHEISINDLGWRIFQFAESYSESDLKNAQLMVNEDVVTGFVEANLRTLRPFFSSFPQQWICALVDHDDDDTVVVEVSNVELVHCKRFQLLAIADENSLPELIESYIQQGLISDENPYPIMRRFDTFLSNITITGGFKSQLSAAGDFSEVIVGNQGTATAGEYGTATAGDEGTATAGDRGTATAGIGGTATAGDYGTATAGIGGTATAGDYGTATAGERGIATAGNQGIATAGDRGTAIVGAYGKAQVLSGSVKTGEFSLGVVFYKGVLSLGPECLGFIRINPAKPSENSRFRAGLGSRIRVELPDHSIIPVVIDGEEYLPDVFYTVNQQREIVEWEKL